MESSGQPMKSTRTFSATRKVNPKESTTIQSPKEKEWNLTNASETQMKANLRNGCLSITQPPFQRDDSISRPSDELHELHHWQLMHNQNGFHSKVKSETSRYHRNMIVSCCRHRCHGLINFKVSHIKMVLGGGHNVVIPRHPMCGKINDVRVTPKTHRPGSGINDLVDATIQLIQVGGNHDGVDDGLLERRTRLKLQSKTNLLWKNTTRGSHRIKVMTTTGRKQ